MDATNKMINSALILAKKAIKKASTEVLKIYFSKEDSKIKDKKNNSPLSKADLLANKIITDAIRNNFPSHAILSEEELDNDKRFSSEYVWIIDPIDGTKDFLEKTGEFTINVALVKTDSQRPVLGIISIPTKNEIYYAIKDQGAFLETINVEDNCTITKKLQVSGTNKLEEMTLAKSARNARPKLEKFLKMFPPKQTISLGSTLKGCAVAKADVDIYLRVCPYSEWDCCAMDLIVNEANGKVTNLQGEFIKYNQKNTEVPGLICSNGIIHKEIVEKLNSIN